jgi:ABC-type Fe3+-hydroxamate transport system substrate-binding protein
VKVAALTPFLSDLVRSFLGEGSLVATVESSHVIPEYNTKLVLRAQKNTNPTKSAFDTLSVFKIDVEALLESQPDVIVTTLSQPESLPVLREELFKLFGRQIFLHHHDPVRFDDVLLMFQNLAIQLKVPDKGKTVSAKVKAQIMDWSQSFYDRTRNKKVSIISSFEPLALYSRWVPDLVKIASGNPHNLSGIKEDKQISWDDLVVFNPDVIIFAPKELNFQETLKLFPKLEQIKNWEKIYAVKRGDVFFTDGQKYFSHPTIKLISSMAILISCMAGMDSGYIAERDSVYRLRYLELHRHKFLK